MNEIGLYDVFELTFTQKVASRDPFAVAVAAIFSHEDNSRVCVEGFFDGDDIFKVRFMPTQIGRWNYHVTLDEREIARGSFKCIPSNLRGPLRQDPAHPYHFVFSNGDPFYVMGNTAYRAIIAYREARDEFCEFLDYYAARRFNWVRFSLANGRGETDDVVFPWGGTPEEPDYTTLNIEHYRHAEGIVQELAARQMIGSVILLNDRPLEKAGAARVAAAKRHIRYAVARLGAYWNVVWCLFNEWNKFCVFTFDEVDELGHHLHTIDPYQRLTACHHYARFEFYEKEWTDLSSIQHRALPGEINRVILQNRLFNKPVLNEEYGYEGDTLQPPSDADNVRHDHWAIALAGGYATYGDKTKGPKIGVYCSARLQDARDTSAPDKLQYLQSFMAQTGYRAMSPCNAFVSNCNFEEVFCLANPGKEYIVYLVKGQSFTINLTHARDTLTAAWYNPRTGEFTRAGDVRVYQNMNELPEWMRGEHSWFNMHRHSQYEFTPPDLENDWVLHLKRVADE